MSNYNKREQKVIPAMTDDAKEAELIALAMNQAEKRLRDGTASNQLILHFLEAGSSKGRLEKDILQNKSELLREQTSAIKENKETDVDYKKVLEALTQYSKAFTN